MVEKKKAYLANFAWSPGRDLNPRPAAYEGVVLGRVQFKDDWMERFHDFLAVDLRLAERTVKLHCNQIKHFLGVVGKNPGEVTRCDVRGFLLLKMRKRSVSTVNNYLKSLKRFYRDWMEKPGIVKSFRFRDVAEKPNRIPSEEDLERFYPCLPDIRDKLTFLMFASSGLRRAELLNLTLKDIDRDERMILPNRSSRTKRTWVTFYNHEAEALLKEHLKNNGLDDSDKLFGSYSTLRRHWRKAEMKSGVHIMPQMLRRWFCKKMGKLGVQDRYVDAFQGRAPKSVLAKRYTDYTPEHLKEIYQNADLTVLS